MMKPIAVCPAHGRMQAKTNGVKFIEHADFGPYHIWEGDKYVCPVCHLEIVVDFGDRPLADHSDSNFAAILEVARKEEHVEIGR